MVLRENHELYKNCKLDSSMLKLNLPPRAHPEAKPKELPPQNSAPVGTQRPCALCSPVLGDSALSLECRSHWEVPPTGHMGLNGSWGNAQGRRPLYNTRHKEGDGKLYMGRWTV